MLQRQQQQEIGALFPIAVQTLSEILNDPKASPSVRLRAALAVLKMAAAHPKESDPEEAEEDIAVSETAGPHLVQPDAQSRTIATVRLPPGPARNSLCPCGSGLKFKRCCSQAQPPLALSS